MKTRAAWIGWFIGGVVAIILAAFVIDSGSDVTDGVISFCLGLILSFGGFLLGLNYDKQI